jgi:hypothetical protein
MLDAAVAALRERISAARYAQLEGWIAPDAQSARRAARVGGSALVLLGAWCQLRGPGKHLPSVMRTLLFAPLLADRWIMKSTLAVRGPLGAVTVSTTSTPPAA